jgi:hypothetical protein
VKGFIYHHSKEGEGVSIFGMGKDVDKQYWFKTEVEAKEYARTHNIKLPPFNRKFEDILENVVIASPWPRDGESHSDFIYKQQRVAKTGAQHVASHEEIELIYRIACRAILLSPALKEKTTVLHVASVIEICHVLHHRLRLAEMAKTSDGSRLLHDIWLIIRSINQETSSWDNVGSPKFSENTPVEGK